MILARYVNNNLAYMPEDDIIVLKDTVHVHCLIILPVE
jgi:hypothetical protein